ncbi:hypothetical protein BC940DRAFT_296074 [Gongronella butleri]|nr:hypothetical protein BC940DRAFT_296074 [Gongronella butleri]
MSEQDLKDTLHVPLSTNLGVVSTHYEAALRRMCSDLLLHYDLFLVVPGETVPVRCRLLEVEAYMKSKAEHGHVDPFVHAFATQYQTGLWHFHRVGASGYRGGTRKGLDVTFGHDGMAGGVLIRAIEVPDTSLKKKRTTQVAEARIIEGPSLVVDYILRQLRHDSIKDLVTARFDKKDGHGAAWDKKSGFYLARQHAPRPETGVQATARIGLDIKRMPTDEKKLIGLWYLSRSYRYAMKWNQLKKGLHLSMVSSARQLGTPGTKKPAFLTKHLAKDDHALDDALAGAMMQSMLEIRKPELQELLYILQENEEKLAKRINASL